MGKGIHEYTKITDLKERHQENLERKATKNLLMK